MDIVQPTIHKLYTENPEECTSIAYLLKNLYAGSYEYLKLFEKLTHSAQEMELILKENPWIRRSENTLVNMFSNKRPDNTAPEEIDFEGEKITLYNIKQIEGISAKANIAIHSNRYMLFVDTTEETTRTLLTKLGFMLKEKNPALLTSYDQYTSSAQLKCAYAIAKLCFYFSDHHAFYFCNTPADLGSNDQNEQAIATYFENNKLSKNAKRAFNDISKAIFPNYKELFGYIRTSLSCIHKARLVSKPDILFKIIPLYQNIATILNPNDQTKIGTLYQSINQFLQKEKFPQRNEKIKSLFTISHEQTMNKLPVSIFGITQAPPLISAKTPNIQFLIELGITEEELNNPQCKKSKKKKTPAQTKKKKKKKKGKIKKQNNSEAEEIVESNQEEPEIVIDQEPEMSVITPASEIINELEPELPEPCGLVEKEDSELIEELSTESTLNLGNNNIKKLIYNRPYLERCNREQLNDYYHSFCYHAHKVTLAWGTKQTQTTSDAYRVPCKVNINGEKRSGFYKVVTTNGVIVHFGPDYDKENRVFSTEIINNGSKYRITSPLEKIMNKCDVREKTIGIPVNLLFKWGRMIKNGEKKITYQSNDRNAKLTIYNPAYA